VREINSDLVGGRPYFEACLWNCVCGRNKTEFWCLPDRATQYNLSN